MSAKIDWEEQRSHHATQLMIEMMGPHVGESVVFDIGCGSGILSIAAAVQGAKQVYICAIDRDATSHALSTGALITSISLWVSPRTQPSCSHEHDYL